jgi:protein-disulfide isomerase-like protein with CxxC motif
MSKQFREQELKAELDSFDQIYQVDDDIDELTGAEYRERCRDRWIVNRRDLVMHSLFLCQTLLLAYAKAFDVDDDDTIVLELDRILQEYKQL